MKLYLQKLELFDYAENADDSNTLYRLAVYCIDNAVDYLYWPQDNWPQDRLNFMAQIEFTTRSIIENLNIDLDKEVLNQEVEVADNDVIRMANYIANMTFIIENITSVDGDVEKLRNYAIASYQIVVANAQILLTENGSPLVF